MYQRDIVFKLMYERLKEFVLTKHRHPNKKDDRRLGDFYFRMKRLYREGKLSEEKYNMLLPYVEFRNELELHWEDMYEKAKKYYEKNGDLYVQEKGELFKWLGSQRQMYQRGKRHYGYTRIKRLESIGMKWNLYDDLFSVNLEEAKKVIQLYGRIPVREENPIRIWISDIKRAYRVGNLDQKRMKELDEIEILRAFIHNKEYQATRCIFLVKVGDIEECHTSIASIINEFGVENLATTRNKLYSCDFSQPLITKKAIIKKFIVKTIKIKI